MTTTRFRETTADTEGEFADSSITAAVAQPLERKGITLENGGVVYSFVGDDQKEALACSPFVFRTCGGQIICTGN